MLRWNAALSGLLLAAVFAVGCEDQKKKEKLPAEESPKMTIETPPPAPAPAPVPAPETSPPTATTPPPTPAPEVAAPAEPSQSLPKESHPGKKAARSKSRVYTTKSGDSLQSIAKKYYNDPKKWRTIYEANRRQIKDPNKIPVGKKLIIP